MLTRSECSKVGESDACVTTPVEHPRGCNLKQFARSEDLPLWSGGARPACCIDQALMDHGVVQKPAPSWDSAHAVVGIVHIGDNRHMKANTMIACQTLIDLGQSHAFRVWFASALAE
jgi:hypothetical protein